MAEYDYPLGRLLIFARAPALGRVKTRLQPNLGAENTLKLHESLIRHSLAQARRSGLCPVELWVSENPHDELFLSVCTKKEIYLQKGADLGARMAHASAEALNRSEYVVLLGADCASVEPAYIQQALYALEQGSQAVLGPAEDGGYVLLGLRRRDPRLFLSMPWGSAEVLARTRESLDRLYGPSQWLELAPRWDVDRPEDLQRLAGLSGWSWLHELLEAD